MRINRISPPMLIYTISSLCFVVLTGWSGDQQDDQQDQDERAYSDVHLSPPFVVGNFALTPLTYDSNGPTASASPRCSPGDV